MEGIYVRDSLQTLVLIVHVPQLTREDVIQLLSGLERALLAFSFNRDHHLGRRSAFPADSSLAHGRAYWFWGSTAPTVLVAWSTPFRNVIISFSIRNKVPLGLWEFFILKSPLRTSTNSLCHKDNSFFYFLQFNLLIDGCPRTKGPLSNASVMGSSIFDQDATTLWVDNISLYIILSTSFLRQNTPAIMWSYSYKLAKK
jgi:hypothetical protein